MRSASTDLSSSSRRQYQRLFSQAMRHATPLRHSHSTVQYSILAPASTLQSLVSQQPTNSPPHKKRKTRNSRSTQVTASSPLHSTPLYLTSTLNSNPSPSKDNTTLFLKTSLHAAPPFFPRQHHASSSLLLLLIDLLSSSTLNSNPGRVDHLPPKQHNTLLQTPLHAGPPPVPVNNTPPPHQTVAAAATSTAPPPNTTEQTLLHS